MQKNSMLNRSGQEDVVRMEFQVVSSVSVDEVCMKQIFEKNEKRYDRRWPNYRPNHKLKQFHT